MVRRRSRPEGDVRAHHAHERASADAGEFPEVLIGPGPSRERIAIRFDPASADDDDGVWTELGNGVVLSGLAEGDESEVHALGSADTKIGTLCAAGFLAGGTTELVLGLDPTSAAAEMVGPAVLAVGQERPIAYYDMLERSHRRKL